MLKAIPFLMFQGEAKAAIEFYRSVLPSFEVSDLRLYGPNEPGVEGTIAGATIAIAGQSIRVIDSPPVHAFTFTPSFSLFLETDEESEFERLAAELVSGGSYLMPPDNYGFSRKFAWLQDQFGLSWQISLI